MKIAAGVGENQAITRAAQKVDFEVVLTESEDELLDLLLKRKVSAAVRGSISASHLMTKLKEIYPDIYRASILEREGHKFLLAPVGIDEGDTMEQKEKIIDYGAQFLKKIGVTPKIGILSGGRPQDRGRSHRIDHSLNEAEDLTRIIRDKYTVKHYFILIEDAIADGANLIIAPDGICGNLIFRSLVFLGSLKSHGAVTLGIEDVLIDTSRSQSEEGYLRALKLAEKLVKLKSQNRNK
ncbi:methanogenesis marker protein Mmp4/MtxX [Methanobacterium ferruginis]|jgi:putative methanogen marker protein 4|uniref:methanogenesis marker protein Mmp4/MtxX n=1 Tax=Methanobacterium ferruginis TaxID=710191 RepID=UPI0025741C8F|nr:methanogenesis marker protein Mmp4/MtxX [Methanobacterium ferruginis]MCC7550085.1 methanogenesis marker protein Mmp4/MtxX [Methanobacterium sp.]BDZ68168.1 methyltransferase [Methanobacterium ferruginis]